MSRSYSILAWTALGLSCLAAFLYRFRVPLVVRGVAHRLAGLAAPIDWIWVLVGSVFLPIVCFVGVMLFSPVGGRSESVYEMRHMLDMPGIMARFSILVALLLILPVLIGRWRFSRKIPLPLPAWKSSLHGWLSVGCLLLLLMISDYKRESWVALWEHRWYLSDEKWLDWLDWDWPRLFLVAVPALWFFVGISKSLFALASGLLARVVVSGVMLKSYAVAMLCLVIVAGGFHLSQQYWFERDHFISANLEEPEFPSYTHRVASQMRKETRELWEGR